MSDARGFTLTEILVTTFVLAVGLVAVATGLQYAIVSAEAGRDETTATFLATQRTELLRGLALTDWNSPLLAAGTSAEGYGTIGGGAPYRRDTAVSDYGGRGCADTRPPDVTCKVVQVTVSFRPLSAGGGAGQERHVKLSTVLVRRT